MSNWNLLRCSRNCISAFQKLRPSDQKNPYLSSFSFFFLFNFSTSTNEGHRTGPTENPVRPVQPPPIRVALTESAGRGVFATRRIGAGELLHTAKPLVSHPSLSSLQRAFYGVETKADWSAYHNYCRSNGLKYPLMVKRFACMVISGDVSADLLDILQPSSLSPQMISEMEEGFSLLNSAFKEANFPDEKMAFLTKQWYTRVLARLRINAFRIELVGGLYDDLFLAAAASVEAEAAVGNAVYMLPSFYNHDCDPNAHILWIENANVKLTALRDVEEGEELRICYIDASMDHEARQTFLSQGFGFRCNCLRCLSGD